MRVVLPCLWSLTACSSLLGIQDVTLGDAGGDADVAPSTVHGTANGVRFVSPTEMVTVPRDLTGFVIQAYSPDKSESGFQIIDGVGNKDGTFTIPDVPAGAYYLFLRVPGSSLLSFYETSSRTPDLGGESAGRIDGAVATAATPLTLHLTGMTAFENRDVVTIESLSTTTVVPATGLTAGTTALDPYTVDWKLPAKPLLSAAHGDDLDVFHTRGVTLQTGVFATTIVDSFTTTSVTLTDGQPSSVSGSFTPATVNGTLRIQLDTNSYLDGLDVPTHMPISVGIDLRAAFGKVALPGAEIAHVNASTTPGFHQFDVPYFDPFPASWPRVVSSFAGLEWTFATRGTRHQAFFEINASQSRAASATFGAGAGIAAPRSIQIGGVDASRAAAVPFDGVHAVPIQWAPVTGVNHYLIVVAHLADIGTTGEVTIPALFDTVSTRVTLPASLFKVGDSYIFEVASVVDGRLYADGALQREPLGTAHREAVTARLLFASSCGNGARDAAYEECDSSGVANAMCNADCTKPVCGDGIANTAAGETCDDVVDSLVCDDDCTAVACGDGHVNTVAGEDCDDGNTGGGDGCTAACSVEAGFTCTGSPSVCTHI